MENPLENGMTRLSVWNCLVAFPVLSVLFIASNLLGHAWGAIKEGWSKSIA